MYTRASYDLRLFVCFLTVRTLHLLIWNDDESLYKRLRSVKEIRNKPPEATFSCVLPQLACFHFGQMWGWTDSYYSELAIFTPTLPRMSSAFSWDRRGDKDGRWRWAVWNGICLGLAVGHGSLILQNQHAPFSTFKDFPLVPPQQSNSLFVFSITLE